VSVTALLARARLRHPLRAALAAAWSVRGYLAAVAAIEDTLRDALAAIAGVATLNAVAAPGAGPDPAATVALAAACEPVASAAPLIALAMQLIHEVPAERLDAAIPAPAGDAPGKAIVLADYLLFAAVDRLTELGPGSVGRVAALLEQLAAPADRAALARSTALAEFSLCQSPSAPPSAARPAPAARGGTRDPLGDLPEGFAADVAARGAGEAGPEAAPEPAPEAAMEVA
jgi:hypothetical protein